MNRNRLRKQKGRCEEDETRDVSSWRMAIASSVLHELHEYEPRDGDGR